MDKHGNQGSPESCRPELISYLYDELTPDQRSGFELHLQTCGECGRDLKDFRQVRSSLNDWTIEESPHLLLRLQPTLAQSFRQLLRAMPLWMRIGAVGAAAVLLMAVSNIRISSGGVSGFQIQAGLRPAPIVSGSDSRPSGPTAEQVQEWIDAAVARDRARHQVEMEANLAVLTEKLESDHRRQLAEVAGAMRREQHQSLLTMYDEIDRRSRPTFASLFLEQENGTSN
ncbi:MAG: zf-HC2 domain-containing protein [Acidobacteria bacterium]|nr:zf-HC2 domain-containing protein [Acidobacteriota bacterium]